MSMRDKHTFFFNAKNISEAALQRAAYHRKRMVYWEQEYKSSFEKVKQQARVEFREYQVTGGMRYEAYVAYGDPTVYGRMQEAYGKIEKHREAADKFEVDAKMYGTQTDRSYELTTDDVNYFGLNGKEDTE